MCAVEKCRGYDGKCAGEECGEYDGKHYEQGRNVETMQHVQGKSAKGMKEGSMCRRRYDSEQYVQWTNVESMMVGSECMEGMQRLCQRSLCVGDEYRQGWYSVEGVFCRHPTISKNYTEVNFWAHQCNLLSNFFCFI